MTRDPVRRPRAALAQLREDWRKADTDQERAELAVLGAATHLVVQVLEAQDPPTTTRSRGRR